MDEWVKENRYQEFADETDSIVSSGHLLWQFHSGNQSINNYDFWITMTGDEAFVI